MADTARKTTINDNQKLPAAFRLGNVKCSWDDFAMGGEAAGTTINTSVRVPAGAVPIMGILLTTTSLGTAEISIGISGATAKYRAQAVFTTTDAPTLFGVASNLGDQLATAEDIIITTAVAVLPSSGTLSLGMAYLED